MATLFTGIAELTTNADAAAPAATIADAALLVDEGLVAWVGAASDAETAVRARDSGLSPMPRPAAAVAGP